VEIALALSINNSILVAYKAIFIEGSDVAILSLATVRQLGEKNVLLGVILGILYPLSLFWL